mmetsp:Transcript_1379/g.2892  ORF Transcript_1379/g.2892 Transcript_1379/m.2892 type:complete len:555 (-) Transcript_1379:31-1695(-)
MIDSSHLFKWAFALSPFPAYLPQYFSMMQQLASDGDNDVDGSSNNNRANDNHKNSNNSQNVSLLNCSVAVDRGGDFLRKRNLHDTPYTFMERNGAVTSSVDEDDVSSFVCGTPSKPSYEHNGGSIVSNHNNTISNIDDQDPTSISEGGLSRATVFLLLTAHLLRMLYFHGLLLEEQRPLALRAGAGLERDDLPAPKAATDSMRGTLQSAPSIFEKSIASGKPSAIQLDLLGQSCSMIVVQLMLLHGMMRLRRKNLKNRRKRLPSDTIPLTSANLNLSPMPSKLSRSTSFPGNSNHTFQSTSNWNGNSHTTSPIQTHWHNFYRRTAAHFLRLLSPVNILRHHSFLEYMELSLLTCTIVTLLFDYHWYPRYRMLIIERLKYASIIFESCLALPQAIKNYGRGTTEGLSIVMVGGWVIGDFMKLCYFLLGMIGSATGEVHATTGDGVDVSHGEGAGEALDGNNVFALGCLLAMAMDLVVGMQMAWWYPTQEVLQLRERVMRSVRHWKANKDDDAGASLLMTGTEYTKVGMSDPVIRSFYRWRKSARTPLDSLQKNSK